MFEYRTTDTWGFTIPIFGVGCDNTKATLKVPFLAKDIFLLTTKQCVNCSGKMPVYIRREAF